MMPDVLFVYITASEPSRTAPSTLSMLWPHPQEHPSDSKAQPPRKTHAQALRPGSHPQTVPFTQFPSTLQREQSADTETLRWSQPHRSSSALIHCHTVPQKQPQDLHTCTAAGGLLWRRHEDRPSHSLSHYLAGLLSPRYHFEGKPPGNLINTLLSEKGQSLASGD